MRPFSISSLLIALQFIFVIQACQNVKTDGGNNEGARRRRAVRTRNYDAITTKQLRDYFTACLNSFEPSYSDWKSVVDYSVLDTTWFEDNALLNCGFGFNRTNCWKHNLGTYINERDTLKRNVRSCIDFYATDFLQHPPMSRFSSVSSRKKRVIANSSPTMEMFTECLNEPRVTAAAVEQQGLDFERLSDFIDLYTINKTCFNENDQETNLRGNSWPRRFVAFTRLDSPLRLPLQDCGETIFPSVFPERFNGLNSWASWGAWSPCSAPCGDGTRTRKRSCVVAESEINASNELCDCDGNGNCSTQTEACNRKEICNNVYWSPWVFTMRCSRSCGDGVQIRKRRCFKTSAQRIALPFCKGVHTSTRSCAYPPCPKPMKHFGDTWTTWSACTATCNSGTQSRKRCPTGMTSCLYPMNVKRMCWIQAC